MKCWNLRRPKTTQERRYNGKRQNFKSPDLEDKLSRPSRSACKLPQAYDDVFWETARSWKNHRKTQYRQDRKSVHKIVHFDDHSAVRDLFDWLNLKGFWYKVCYNLGDADYRWRVEWWE